jgi:hypothetical protein
VPNDLKLKIYPAVIGILGICLVASLFANVEIQVERSTPTRTRSPAPDPLPDSSPDVTASPTPTTPPALPSPLALAPPLPPEVLAEAEGGLRVSNQTEYPLRVALLQPAETELSSAVQPVHWDFEPGEGYSKGLMLSLPNQNLQLQPGDVLVAFAQDGSRRYWGPYIVGTSSSPLWNADTSEWQLILQP